MNWLSEFLSGKTGLNLDEDSIRKDEHGLDNVDDFWSACSVSTPKKVQFSPPIPSDEASDEQQTTRVKELLHSPTEHSSPPEDPVMPLVTQRSRPSSEQRRIKQPERMEHESVKVLPLYKQMFHIVEKLEDDGSAPSTQIFSFDSPQPPEPERIQKPKRKAKSQKVKTYTDNVDIDMPRPPAELIDIIDAEREAESNRKPKKGLISLFPSRPTEPEEERPRPTSVFNIAPEERIEMERACFRKKEAEPKESQRKSTLVRERSPSPESPVPEPLESPPKRQRKKSIEPHPMDVTPRSSRRKQEAEEDAPPVKGTPRPSKKKASVEEDAPPIKGTPRPSKKKASVEEDAPPVKGTPRPSKKKANVEEDAPPVKGTPRPSKKKASVEEDAPPIKGTPRPSKKKADVEEDATPVRIKKTATKSVTTKTPEKLKSPKTHTPVSRSKKEGTSTPRSSHRSETRANFRVATEWSKDFDKKYEVLSDDDTINQEDVITVPEQMHHDDDDLPLAMRRTKRVKVKPLRFWLGERIIYRLEVEDGLPGFDSVKLARDEQRK